MPSKMYYKSVITEVDNLGCTEMQQESLLEFFKRTMKHVAARRIRKAWFELKDFDSSKNYEIENFCLLIERENIEVEGLEMWDGMWKGHFECAGKWLRVQGMLEKY